MKLILFCVTVIIASCHDPALETGNNGKNLEFEYSRNTLNSLAAIAAASRHQYPITSEGQRRCIEFEKVWPWKIKKELLIKCQRYQMGKRRLRKGRSITYNLYLNLCPRGLRYSARRERCVPRFFG